MNGWTSDIIGEVNEDAIIYPEYEEALIGIAYRAGGLTAVAVYDYDECVRILIEEGMNEEEAIEHFDFNTLGAWVGDNTPIFLKTNIETI